jgi:DNA-binding NtrC family response regulator
MILVIDDFAPQRHVRKRLLEDAGYEVREAATAEEARGIIAMTRPEVVVSDIGLPDQNGIALCADLKRADAGLPIIMITERYRGIHVRQDAMRAGADAFLTEPVDRDQLLRIVAKLGRFDPPADPGRE